MKILLLILLMISSQSRASDLVQIHAYCSDIGSMAMNVMALRQQNIALPEAERVIRTQFQYDLENSEVSQYLSEALGAAYATPIERKVGQEFQQAEWHRLVFMDMLGNYHEQGKWKLKNKTVKVMCEFWA